MCKAYVLRFCCGHGVLMSLEPCRLGPCPMIKTCGEKLPQQPYKCYSCQRKREQRTSRGTTVNGRVGSSLSCAPEIGQFDERPIPSMQRSSTFPHIRNSMIKCSPPSSTVRKPGGCSQFNNCQKSTSNKPFAFTCTTYSSCSEHLPMPPHYSSLPGFLPHQDHACPPCQLAELRQSGVMDVTKQATAEYPSLTEEMLIRNGTLKEWQPKPTLAQYLDERLTEEREMWLHVTRKWTQDLKKIRVLVSEEDGLGLMT